MAKRILRNIVMVVIVGAALVFVFDNRDSSTLGVVGSVAVMILCFLIWQVFDLADVDGSKADTSKE